MMKQFLTIALLSLTISLPTSASAEVEEWYTYWAIGSANHNYPNDLDNAIAVVDSIPGVDRTEIAYDMFGFNWPYDNNTTLGFVISGSSDRLEDSFGDYIQFNHYLYGFSAMRFFGREIGDGFYVRGDAGIAKIRMDTNIGFQLTSDNGTGYLLGFGYAWPISGQSRVLIGMRFSNSSIEGDNVSSTAFTIGGLW